MTRVSAFVAMMMVALVAWAGQAHASQTILVHPGESIQAAIDSASPGDAVEVLQGVYYEMVEVRTDYITLRGRHAIIRPPSELPDRACVPYGGAGICIAAKEGDFATGVVKAPVVGDRIRGFTIRGFTSGVYTFGAYRTIIKHNRVSRNMDGIASKNSSLIKYIDNVVSGNDKGLWLSNYGGGRDVENPDLHLPNADALLHGNDVYNNRSGITVNNTSVGSIRGNNVHANAVGIDFEEGFSGMVKDWTIKNNRVHDNHKFFGPAVDTGMWLQGISGFHIVHNRVVDNPGPLGNTFPSAGGIVLQSSADYEGESSNNIVRGNTVLRNHPNDIFFDGTGGDTNLFLDNTCVTSIPLSICSGSAV